MPIYEYSCKKCGSVIERIQKFSDPPLKKHEDCGGALTKLISQSAFQLKGSGWYVTDYAGKGAEDRKEKTDSAGKDGKDSKGSGDSGGEAKSPPQESPSDKTGKKPAKKTGTDRGGQ